MTGQDASSFTAQNLYWLKRWIEVKPKRARHRVKAQVYRRTRIHYPIRTPITLAQVVVHLTESLNAEFVPMMIHALIFGVKYHQRCGDLSAYYISGFYEQTGRLPTPKDKVVIHASEWTPIERPTVYENRSAQIEVWHHWRINRLEIL